MKVISSKPLLFAAVSPIVGICNVIMLAIMMPVTAETSPAITTAELIDLLCVECDYAGLAPRVQAGTVEAVIASLSTTVGTNLIS
jgi:hypothetical protein